jgi:hypothetical protein
MSTPELLICPASATALERTRFFPRQLVTPDDLTQDQVYFRDRLRRHNRLLHGWGVVCGAWVRLGPRPGTVVIEPGYVLGPQGDEIVIDDEVTVDLFRETTEGLVLAPCADPADPWCTDVRVDRRSGLTFYPAVRYAECEGRPVRVATDTCGCDLTECQYSRIRDSFAVKLLDELPASYRAAPAGTAAGRTPAGTRCAEFLAPDRQPGGSRVVEGATFELPGAQETQVLSFGGFIGLVFEHTVRVTLPEPAGSVMLTVCHPEQFLRVTAHHQDGSNRLHAFHPDPHPQGEVIPIDAVGITEVTLETKGNAGLQSVCWEAGAGRTGAPRPCPPCPADPWVVLGGVTFRAGGEVATLDPTHHRRWVLSLAGHERWGGAPPAPDGGTSGTSPAGRGEIIAPAIDIGRLGELVEARWIRRLEAAGGAPPAAVADLPATALRGVGRGSVLGRALGGMRLAHVADRPREEFIAEIARAARRPADRPDLERRAAEIWTRAREALGRP